MKISPTKSKKEIVAEKTFEKVESFDDDLLEQDDLSSFLINTNVLSNKKRVEAPSRSGMVKSMPAVKKLKLESVKNEKKNPVSIGGHFKSANQEKPSAEEQVTPIKNSEKQYRKVPNF